MGVNHIEHMPCLADLSVEITCNDDKVINWDMVELQ